MIAARVVSAPTEIPNAAGSEWLHSARLEQLEGQRGRRPGFGNTHDVQPLAYSCSRDLNRDSRRPRRPCAR